MSDKKHSHPSSRQEESPLLRLFRSSLMGLLTFGGSSLVLLLITALICLKLSDPDTVMLPLATACSFLSAMLGGFAAVRCHGEGAIPVGLLTGGILFLLTLLAAACLPADASGALSGSMSVILRLFLPIFSTLGALLGVNLKSKKKKHR